MQLDLLLLGPVAAVAPRPRRDRLLRGSDTFHFVDPPYVNSGCGHCEDAFNEQNMEQLLLLLETVKGKFMLTMFPFDMIDRVCPEERMDPPSHRAGDQRLEVEPSSAGGVDGLQL